jgi:hypothetical protein
VKSAGLNPTALAPVAPRPRQLCVEEDAPELGDFQFNAEVWRTQSAGLETPGELTWSALEDDAQRLDRSGGLPTVQSPARAGKSLESSARNPAEKPVGSRDHRSEGPALTAEGWERVPLRFGAHEDASRDSGPSTNPSAS